MIEMDIKIWYMMIGREYIMFDFLALITNRKYWYFHSIIIKFILKVYGIKVGRNFYCEGVPKLKIRGKAENITIGNNVSFLGNVDLRNRENGRIAIDDGVVLEDSVRLVSARDGTIKIGANTVIAKDGIINGGADIIIGNYCLFSARVMINANEHEMKKDDFIRKQGFVHKCVLIGDDCLFGVNVTINKGVTIKHGSVFGANSVITKDSEEYSVNAGIPSKKIAERL
jgi:acetyltransferase-like isoleucine patch superfamily enzyme